VCDVWGELVELCRRCVPSALNFEQLSIFQALLYISARTRGKRRLVYEATSEVRDFRRLWVEKSRIFLSGEHYTQRLDRRDFPVTIFLRNVNKMCVCQLIQRYRHVVQFVLRTAEHNNEVGQNRQRVASYQAIITLFLRILNRPKAAI